MASAASLTAGVAGRYAVALFELARERDRLDRVEQDMEALEAVLRESEDLRTLIASPIYNRVEQGRAIRAIAERMGLTEEVTNTLGVMAMNRRLFVLPRMIEALKGLIAEHRGEVTAEVVAARPLDERQREALARTLKEKVGRDVKLDVTVDEGLIGGLVVKVGSRMIDTSIRTKLANLHTLMKEAG